MPLFACLCLEIHACISVIHMYNLLACLCLHVEVHIMYLHVGV